MRDRVTYTYLLASWDLGEAVRLTAGSDWWTDWCYLNVFLDKKTKTLACLLVT